MSPLWVWKGVGVAYVLRYGDGPAYDFCHSIQIVFAGGLGVSCFLGDLGVGTTVRVPCMPASLNEPPKSRIRL